jgi:hypothetical protein
MRLWPSPSSYMLSPFISGLQRGGASSAALPPSRTTACITTYICTRLVYGHSSFARAGSLSTDIHRHMYVSHLHHSRHTLSLLLHSSICLLNTDMHQYSILRRAVSLAHSGHAFRTHICNRLVLWHASVRLLMHVSTCTNAITC